MSGIAEFSGSRRVPQLAALALIAFGVAGCSADMTSRFQQSSVANPFGYQGDATGNFGRRQQGGWNCPEK